ncbi:lipoprotein [Limnohabitans sp. Rim47]|uniref:LPS translocon maturation chaperone LptM n=1 Tax=Limnohabitans sp. Rim47 TaxID=1100721 RepID=UPI0002F11580|nr:lipoprotein [Limnohabitans sp. Rim47]
MAHALAGGAAMLTACGQKGALVLPSTPESAGRAPLHQTLKLWPATAPSSAPTTSPVTAPEATTAAPQ